MDILEKLKASELKGRGGGAFSTALKWELVKKAKGKINMLFVMLLKESPMFSKINIFWITICPM